MIALRELLLLDKLLKEPRKCWMAAFIFLSRRWWSNRDAMNKFNLFVNFYISILILSLSFSLDRERCSSTRLSEFIKKKKKIIEAEFCSRRIDIDCLTVVEREK